MKLDQMILDRLDELIEMGERVIQTKHEFEVIPGVSTDCKLSYQWGTSCLSIFNKAFGPDSTHYTKFNDVFNKISDYGYVLSGMGILKAAREDYEKGLLFDTRVLIEAEVFDDFLEQAEYLLDSGYYQPAAVIAGSVLEDGLRKLCLRNDEINLPANPKLDRMNADLAKKGVYNKLKQKQITALADLRNKAAHGNWDEFGKSDVESMIKNIREFMSRYFS